MPYRAAVKRCSSSLPAAMYNTIAGPEVKRDEGCSVEAGAAVAVFIFSAPRLSFRRHELSKVTTTDRSSKIDCDYSQVILLLPRFTTPVGEFLQQSVAKSTRRLRRVLRDEVLQSFGPELFSGGASCL